MRLSKCFDEKRTEWRSKLGWAHITHCICFLRNCQFNEYQFTCAHTITFLASIKFISCCWCFFFCFSWKCARISSFLSISLVFVSVIVARRRRRRLLCYCCCYLCISFLLFTLAFSLREWTEQESKPTSKRTHSQHTLQNMNNNFDCINSIEIRRNQINTTTEKKTQQNMWENRERQRWNGKKKMQKKCAWKWNNMKLSK